MEFLTSTILAGIAYDLIKNGTLISLESLKNKLKGWLISDENLKILSQKINNIDNLDERCQVVAENDELSLGKHKLVFILHCIWRDCIIRRNIDLKRLSHSFQISFYHHPNARIIKFFHDFFY